MSGSMTGVSGIGVIVNPRSRQNRGRSEAVVRQLEAIVGQEGSVYACGDPETLVRALHALKRDQVSVLAICGGDGTYSYVMGHAETVFGADALPPVALIRGGTMNTTANGLGIPKGKPEQLLRELVATRREGREFVTMPRPLMRGGGRLGCLFGTGLVVRYLEEYYRRGREQPTPWTALTTLSSAAMSALVRGPLIRHMAAPERLVLTLDGEEMEAADYVTIAAGTVPEFGLGFAPFPHALEDASRFEVLGTTVNPAAFLIDLARMRTGRTIKAEHGFVRMAKEMQISRADGEPTLQVMFDGDVMSAEAPFTLSVGPVVQIVLSEGGSARGAHAPA